MDTRPLAGDHRVGGALEPFDLPLDLVRSERVARVEPLNQIALRLAVRVVASHGSPAWRATDELQRRARATLDLGHRLVRRAVVHDDDFPACPGLSERGIDGRADARGRVADG